MPSAPSPLAARILLSVSGRFAAARVALALSGFLLFSLPPLVARIALPRLGDAPATWSVALVFLQAVLCAGFLGAQAIARVLTAGQALGLRLALMAASVPLLPPHLPTAFAQRPPAGAEAPWALALFAAAAGLPAVVLALQGPLLQMGFARAVPDRIRDLPRLSTAWQGGAVAALLADPLLVEPFLSVPAASLAWTIGFGLLAAPLALAGWPGAAPPPPGPAAPRAAPVTAGLRAGWIALAAVPAALLVAVSGVLAAAVAAAPLAYALPLALYVLSFGAAFRDGSARALRWLAPLQLLGTVAALLGLAIDPGRAEVLGLVLALFPVNAVLCHAVLYGARPVAADLAQYHACLALGGVLGSVAGGLLVLAPVPDGSGLPLLLGAALLARPGLRAGGRRRLVEAALVLGLLVTFAPLLAGLPGESLPSFFGRYRVATSPDGRARLLFRDTTLRGAMRLDGRLAAEHPDGLLADAPDAPLPAAIRAIRAARGGDLGDVAVIGIGTGSLACEAEPREAWTFLEVDPAAGRIARDPARFGFLTRCGPTLPLLLGDPRRRLADEPADLGLIVIDDAGAVPAHLLTVEALRLAVSKLDRTGVMLVRVAHRHLDPARALARAGAEIGLPAWRFRADGEGTGGTLLALARDPAHLGTPPRGAAWRRLPADGRRPWTDGRAPLTEALLDRWRE
ncbi:hypothetical protein [Methylobacterium sp. JK268]